MSHRRLWALIALLVFGGAALALWLSAALSAPEESYERARRAWAQGGPLRYQLDFQLSGDELSGEFRAEVEGDLVRSLIDTASGQPVAEAHARALAAVLPVEQLFARLGESYRPTGRVTVDLVRRQPGLGPIVRLLGLAPAMCWVPQTSHVSYDQALGYPRRLAWSNNRCDSGMFSLDSFDLEITALRPLP